MPRFEPFAALRYAASESLDDVIAPPYDVLSERDVEELAARSPHNIVHIDVPRGAADRYERAADVLRQWVTAGVLVLDRHPAFTLYRMTFTDEGGTRRETVGVLGALEVRDQAAGGVLPHERTTPKASTDRLDLTRATEANLSPVWGLSLAAGLTDVLRAPGDVVGHLEVDGVTHTVERVDDPDRVAAISQAVAAADVLIADGHHRYGVARQYLAETAGRIADAELTLAYVAELTGDQLAIDAIHRLYRGDVHELKAALATSFDISEAPEPTPATLAEMGDSGRLVLLEPGRASWLAAKPGAFDGVRALDGAWLEHALQGVQHVVEYQHGLAEVQEAVTEGRADAAVLIRPTSITEIERTAREGLLMPPKSTFFTPKLRTGFVIRPMR